MIIADANNQVNICSVGVVPVGTQVRSCSKGEMSLNESKTVTFRITANLQEMTVAA
jgi:hypothetical protein